MAEQKSNNVGWKRVLLLVVPYILIVGIFQYIGYLVAGVDLMTDVSNETSLQQLIVSAFDLFGTFLLISVFMKFVDKQRFLELGFHTKNRLIDFVFGIILGGLIMGSGYLILEFLGEISFTQITFNLQDLTLITFHFLIVALVEETLFRGYILKNLMTSFNKYGALISSSILFSLMHGFNPNISMFSLFELFVGGILLGITYIYTKNLWFPIALHFSWNLFQSLLGFNVSGLDSYSIIEHQIVEENLINGGEFGFEGSILSILAQLIAIVVIVFYYNRKKPITIQVPLGERKFNK
ncbi:MAG: CPBP family intramembrane metalloprotease [Muricauda sp.]|nr:type II CAAX endopeptidase family protein [Allomuricauda sp.]MBC31975.1 CPBP family intramembrane metalloprotease [Allomuricauda sp.]|tara:strand:+ start:271 stop:1155 length:885 start_codon:yes stop_codon:yes gene_type:complete